MAGIKAQDARFAETFDVGKRGGETVKQQTVLNYPDTWNNDTRDIYEHLHSRGKVTQADIDEIVERLAWWRGWRDYFQTTGGRDLTVYPDVEVA